MSDQIPVTDATEIQEETIDQDLGWDAITGVDSQSQQSAIDAAINDNPNQQQPVQNQQAQSTAQQPENNNQPPVPPQQPVQPQQPPAFQPRNFVEVDEDGNEVLNSGELMNFISEQSPVDVPAPNAAYQNSMQQFQMQQQGLPPKPAEPEVDPIVEYENETRSNIYHGLDMFEKYVKSGNYTMEQAYYAARDSLDKAFNSHMTTYRYNQQNKHLEERQEKFQEEQRIAAMQPKATQNLEYVAKKGRWGSGNDLKNYLVDKNAGGEFAHALFTAMDPNYMKFEPGQTQESFNKKIDDMMTKVTANIEMVKVWEKFARLNSIAKHLPKLLREANTKGQQVTQGNANARTGAPRKKTMNYNTSGKKSGNSTVNFLKGAGYNI